MKDVLGRELEINDIVIVSDFGIGLWNGTSVTFESTCKISYARYFKVVNPSKEELELKEKILSNIKKQDLKEKERKAARMAKKKIPKKELVIGKMYKDDEGTKWLYLGNCKCNDYITFTDGTKIERGILEGYCYIRVSLCEVSEFSFENARPYEVKILKSQKRLVEMIETDRKWLDETIQITELRSYYNRKTHVMQIDLLDVIDNGR